MGYYLLLSGIFFLTLQRDLCVSEYLCLLQRRRSGSDSLPAVGEQGSLPGCEMEERSAQKDPVSQN